LKAQIHSRKHYVQWTLTTVATAALSNETIAVATTPSAVNLPTEVTEGSTIKAVYVEVWITADDTSGSSFTANLEKVPGGNPVMSYANSIALDGYVNKKNVFYTTQGLMAPNDEMPSVIFRGWFKIPKGKQRMGSNDTIKINLSAITNGMNYCGFATYKEYT